ncbi:hypothetical protein pb186bvf_019802 [Paramecium bursaria]
MDFLQNYINYVSKKYYENNMELSFQFQHLYWSYSKYVVSNSQL